MDVPVPTGKPPQEVEYHFQIAPDPNVPPFTVSVTLVPALMEVALAVIPVAATLGVLMVRFNTSV
jgi:hypothetical protein